MAKTEDKKMLRMYLIKDVRAYARVVYGITHIKSKLPPVATEGSYEEVQNFINAAELAHTLPLEDLVNYTEVYAGTSITTKNLKKTLSKLKSICECMQVKPDIGAYINYGHGE